MVDKSWNGLLSNPLVLMPILCTVVVAVVILTLVVVVARKNCGSELIGYQSSGAACHELHCECLCKQSEISFCDYPSNTT